VDRTATTSQAPDATPDHLIRGHEYLEQFPDFELVGRDDVLTKLAAILTRERANNVLLIGPGGVGCSAVCLGLQESKGKPNTPFDIVGKRFFWLDSDWLFSSGSPERINGGFDRALRTLSRTPDSVLILDDMRDFIDAARNNGCTNLINALMRSVKRKKFQVVIETRDEDLEAVLKCHSDMQESYTMLDVHEPGDELLREIVASAASKRLQRHHKIRIAQSAIDTAIEVTSNYRTRDIGLSRAQPERTLTLLDRSLTSYRLAAHSKDPRLDALERKRRAIASDASEQGPAPAALASVDAEIAAIAEAWAARQQKVLGLYKDLRDGEDAIRALEIELEDQLERERELLAEAPDAADEDERLEKPKQAYVPFAARTAGAGYDSDAAAAIKRRMAEFQGEVAESKAAFERATAEINDSLELTKEHVLAEFSNISGIPISKLTQDERAKLLHLDKNLSSRVFGQAEAVRKLANQVRVARAGLQSPDKPQAAFMFLGPSGVGKTELAKALTAELFDDERSLLRFDMSEYMEKHAVAKLIGAPPGYEGYEAGGILTNEMRRNPRRIVLFDEIEKAHADIFNVFLQILDDARLTDNRGLTVSFRDAIILMTTNIGTAHFLGEDDFEVARKLALEDLDEHYRPEFLARFNGKRNIVCFNTLPLEVIEQIAARDIRRLDAMVKKTLPNVSVAIDPAALAAMCKDHYKPVTGARGITGYIEGVIKPEIANTVLFDHQAEGRITIRYDESRRVPLIEALESSAA
jgi:ATP-dependent Clp protease ATP-binding subunit ClpB